MDVIKPPDYPLMMRTVRSPPTDNSLKHKYTVDEDKKGLAAEYCFEFCSGKFVTLRKDGAFVDTLNVNDEGAVILDKTCFYAEQGGEIYDTKFPSKLAMSQKRAILGATMYSLVRLSEDYQGWDEVHQDFDTNDRPSTMKNHTGTHVLNHCLRKVLENVD